MYDLIGYGHGLRIDDRSLHAESLSFNTDGNGMALELPLYTRAITDLRSLLYHLKPKPQALVSTISTSAEVLREKSNVVLSV